MFLNYPNNPTGATASKDFFDETIHFANKHNILVVHDFAYGAIGFDGQKPVSFLQADGAKDTGNRNLHIIENFQYGWLAHRFCGRE